MVESDQSCWLYRAHGSRETCKAPESKPAHKVHVCPIDSAEFRRDRKFRDYLRARPEVAKKYATSNRDALRRFLPRPNFLHKRRKRFCRGGVTKVAGRDVEPADE